LGVRGADLGYPVPGLGTVRGVVGRRVATLTAVCVVLVGCGSPARLERTVQVSASITVDSPDITEGGPIPARYTCDGQGVSPPLRWSGVPPDAAVLALVVDDPDAPRGTYTHWVVVDIDPAVTSVARGQSPPGAQQIVNSAGRAFYMGPCPPSGVHHYRFTVYALSRRLALPSRASLQSALDAIAEAATAQGRLTGTYRR
jgi:Raf kinase inhibitor-like YbhB/YbcL family protein